MVPRERCFSFAHVAWIFLAGAPLLTFTKLQVPGITYHLATCGGQNCDSVCGTFGLMCARTGQSFPSSSALPIFESLGIDCITDNFTDAYVFEDNPNYWAEDAWAGRCLGFKSIPATIECVTANNTAVRRLCPCLNPLVTGTTTPLNSTNASTSTLPSTKTTTEPLQTSNSQTTQSKSSLQSAPHTSINKSHPTAVTTAELKKKTTSQENPTRVPPEQVNAGAARVDIVERSTFIIASVLGGALVLCMSALAFVLLRNRKRLRAKQNSGTENEKLHGGCHVNKNALEMQEMIDGLTVEINTEEGQRYSQVESGTLSAKNPMELASPVKEKRSSYYENVKDNETENILYVSIPEENVQTLLQNAADPVYDRLVN